MDGTRASEFQPSLEIKVARSFDDLQRVFAVRTLVYMSEQHCPYDEEFDGNDLSGAMHLMALEDGEPVGCLRIRWFSDFAKIERVCVRSTSRAARVGVKMMDRAREIMARKGYRRYCGQIQKQLIDYWQRQGLVVREHRGQFVFSDRVYVEVEGKLDVADSVVDMDSDPLVLDRPEGDWDLPGPLDQSIMRGYSPTQFDRKVKTGLVDRS